MRLVSLDIKGFKSFPDKTSIHFNDNITGIVGPNGCGKSNIVDAVRWVLGEQKTSQLRSEKMEDVIFNGTRARKSASLAEVSLTLDNNKGVLPSEYTTITISRHYFRSGDSEYRLNNVPCRLKDITNLFLDTGISSNSYAIIELAKVNEILEDKENSRRRLFEQAAGISKFKTRKRETLQKLEATDTDLNRVQDLLFEIENNLKTLESQAKRTERYYKLKEEYKELSLILALLHIAKHKVTFEELAKQQQDEEQKRIAVVTEIDTKEASIQSEKNASLEKEKALAAAQKALTEHLNLIKQKENERNLAAQNLKYSKEKIDTLGTQTDELRTRISQFQQQIHQLEELKGLEEKQLITLQEELNASKDAAGAIRGRHSEMKEQVNTKQVAARTLENDVVQMEKKSTVWEVQKEGLQKELANLQVEFNKRQEELSTLKQREEQLKEEENQKKLHIDELTQQGDALQAEITAQENSLEQERQKLVEINRTLDARQNEYKLTKSFIENMEGFPDSIKFLKQRHNEWSPNAPLLSDIFSCPADYRVAIESFLEPYLNYYIVQNVQEAIKAVQLLSSTEKGRANFFILSEFANYVKKETTAPEGSVPALQVVEFDNAYQNLGNYLLDRACVVDNDTVDGEYGDAIIISKKGKIIRYPYAVTGGMVGNFTGKRIGRVKNLENLQKEIETLTTNATAGRESLTAMQTALQQLRQSSTDNQLNAAREQLNKIRNEMAGVHARMENIEVYNRNYNARVETIQQQNATLDEQINGLQGQLDVLYVQRDQLIESLEELTLTFTDVEQEMNDANDGFNKKNIAFLQQQNKINTHAQELNFVRQQLDNTHKNINQNTELVGQLQNEISQLAHKLEEIDVEMQTVHDQRLQFENGMNEAERQYFESRNGINVVEEEIRLLHRQKEQILTLLQSLHDRNNELRLQLSSLKERLDIEFQVSLDSLLDQPTPEKVDEEDLREKVEKMRDRVQKYGEINPMAMEAFTEMKQRYDFMVAQKTDLHNAKQSLMQTMEEIETSAKEQFMDAFNKVRHHFSNVYHTLFNPEDKCDLILEDPDNPLESRIEIIAQPKGKRPSTINQLSGGEKTLTAISVLFGLYLIKPAPFCILDEVDAPLDDANVSKFANIIREFSQNSQFIIVTHNKQTMTNVDVIYGITMAEEGVSRVVPVDFRSLN